MYKIKIVITVQGVEGCSGTSILNKDIALVPTLVCTQRYDLKCLNSCHKLFNKVRHSPGIRENILAE